jgi:hypothetical protein
MTTPLYYSPGYHIWTYSTPVLTVAASPLLSPWFNTEGYTDVLPVYKFTGGTSVITFDGSFDGVNVDSDLTTAYGTITSGTSVPTMSPYFRVRVVQTIADNTVTKIFLKSRA